MSTASELAELFARDLRRLKQELEVVPDEDLWRRLPGISNSAGNLVLHLEGNLREYIGRQLGSVPFERDREQEFGRSGVAGAELSARVAALEELIPPILRGLNASQMRSPYPEEVFGAALSTGQFLVHLHGHFNYHLGQIDYLRRILGPGKSIPFAIL
jgi:hypothetical protein